MLNLTNPLKIVVIVALCVQLPFVYSYDLGYKLRGDNRYEGIAPELVSGSYGIELLSALIFNTERWEPTPNNCKLKFYLPNQTDANLLKIRVQELKPDKYYLMNPIDSFPWKQGFNNFQWPTDVIKQVPLKISKLGVIADLKPTSDMRSPKYVAPVMFYHSAFPETANAYLFAFKVGGKAKLDYAMYKGDSQTPFLNKSVGTQLSVVKPFVIMWDSSKASEDTYKLVVKGKFLGGGVRAIRKVVYFYHKPLIN